MAANYVTVSKYNNNALRLHSPSAMTQNGPEMLSLFSRGEEFDSGHRYSLLLLDLGSKHLNLLCYE